MAQYAATMAYVENTLNFTNGYYKVSSSEDDQFEYLVPFPPEYESTMKAYWTTDVIVLDPSCSWQTPTTATYIKPSEIDDSSWDVTLSESNLSVIIQDASLGMFLPSSDVLCVYSISEYVSSGIAKFSVYICENKSSESTVPVDGSVLFVIDQPDSNTTFPVELSNFPTSTLPTGDVLAFILCSPHASIRTHQVWATGNGNLTLGKPQRSQGNIDLLQANYLLSYALLELATSSGPSSFPAGQLGTDLMETFFFGYEPVDYGDFRSHLAPLSNITAMYKQVILPAMKTYLSGNVDTETVPGGYTEEQMVFTSSLGHVLTSAILFVFLTIALVVAQFRKRRVTFTFVNMAAALADSDVPQKCVEMTQFKVGRRKVLKLVASGDGTTQFCLPEH